MTDNQLIKELNQMAFIAERRAERKAIIFRNAVARIEELTTERDEARRDCAVAEFNHQSAINDYKFALLKKIFPYDTADKKQYSINAYAVERAIIEVAEELYDNKRDN